MKINKLKAISIAVCCFVVALCSGSQGMDRTSLEDHQSSLKYSEFLLEYNSIGEDHQCSLRNMDRFDYASLGFGDEVQNPLQLV